MNRIWIIRAAVALTGAMTGVLLAPVPASAQRADGDALRLTLADAVERAIDHNPDLAIVRLDTEVESARVGESRGVYAPIFSTALGRSRNVTPPTNYLLGDAGVDQRDWFSSTGVRQRLPWGGGVWSLSWDAARTTTNSPLSSFDPNVQSGIQLAVSQPLLKDRKIDSARQQYIVSKRNRDNSELRLQEAVVRTMAAVKQAYWTFKATVANVNVQQQSLDLAQELARQNRIRVAAGDLPPVDLVQAEAEVAQRRENLIQARATAGDAEDRLRRLIMNPADGSFWKVGLEPVDEAPPTQSADDVDAAVARALGARLDIAQAAGDLQNATTNVEFLNNQRLPDIRLEASYRGSGLGGTEFLRTGAFPGVVTALRERSFSDALGQAFSPDYPTWSFGVTVSYPIGRSYEQASLARAEVEQRQAAQRIASLQLDAAQSVRQAGRQVQSTAERVDAAQASATLAEQRLRDEERRFAAGLSTTFLVTQAQRDLLQAQVNVLQTSLDYQSAVVNFEAVQQAAPAGGSSTVSVRGANIVLLPTPAPAGIFRPGAGQ
jgi:HAE1 family hydrophobic/amphiphilic exporter-1